MTINIHLSTTGDDLGDGSQGSAVSSCQRAQVLVRQARANHPHDTIRVCIAAGTYRLQQPLRFGESDGGSADAPVVWSAEPGARVIFSGGFALSDWRNDRINGVDCLTTELPDGPYPLQLFVDGQRAAVTRLPAAGWFRFASSFGKDDQPTVQWGNGPEEAEYAAGDLRAFRNLDDVRLVVMGTWYDAQMRITAIDEDRRAVRFHRRTWSRLMDETGRSTRYCIENAREALSAPGSWYADRRTRRIHYIPLPGQSAETITAIIPAVDRLLHIDGASHLRFEHIAFHHADWHPPETYRGSIQASHLVPGSILVERSEKVVFYGCDVAHVASYGIELGLGSRDCRVVACTLHDLGAGGVRVDHEWLNAHAHEITGEPAGVRGVEQPRAAIISDNAIHHGGRIYSGAIGIYVGNAGFCRILHNRISHFHYTGISVGWTWGHAATATVDNRIEGNHVHDINRELMFSDNGAIYTLGRQPGSTIRGNHLHHVSSYGYGGDGIYPDEGSSGFVIEDNVVHHCRHGGYSCHYGRDLLVRNNIFAWSELEQINPLNRAEAHVACILHGNIVAWKQGVCGSKTGWSLDYLDAEGNILWAEGIPLLMTGGRSPAQLEQEGQMRRTLVADPRFVDPDGGDFRLRPGSPAVAHGFRPLDVSDCGPRGGRALPADYGAWLSAFPDPADRPILHAQIDQLDERRLQLHIHNPGRVPASGRWRVRPSAGLALDGIGDEIAVDELPPGQARVIELPMRPMQGGTYALQLWPTDGHPVPACLRFTIGAPSFRLARLPGPIALPGIAEALAALPAEPLTHDGAILGQARLAVAGDRLLLWARILDRSPRRLEPNWWEGSCLEVFVAAASGVGPNDDRAPAPCTPPGSGADKPRQLVLFPEPRAGKLDPYRYETFHLIAKPEVESSLVVEADGYAACVSMPLALFDLPADARTCRLEVAAGAYPRAGARAVKALLFGAPMPNLVTRGMARAAIAE